MREPDFNNLLAVLRRQRPERPTLFEFFLNGPLYKRLAGPDFDEPKDALGWSRLNMHAFRNAGYDYATIGASDFGFPQGQHDRAQTISQNQGARITDRQSFEAYPWPDPDAFDYSRLTTLAPELPAGMKFVVHGPGGVLENAIGLAGYENVAMIVYDDPALAQALFDAIGSRLVRHYQLVLKQPGVGAIISNDDWGFKTQTLLAPADMRRYVFPWHKRIVQTAHDAGVPAILHSCGELAHVMDDVIDDMRFDGKHSFEDAILPVEDAYARWGSRIAILGGIDVDFIVRSSPDAITQRSRQMLERAARTGSYALGTGNSVPEYIPQDHYFAMTRAAVGI